MRPAGIRRLTAPGVQSGKSGRSKHVGGEHWQDPRDILGADHPLTRAVDMAGSVARHSYVVAAVLAGSIVDVGKGEAWATAVVVSAGVVLLGLLLVFAILWQTKRDRALDLILEGRASIQIAAVQRECERLGAPRTQRRLARTIEGMIALALKPPRSCSPSARPLFQVAVVASAAEDLRSVCRLLRAERASVRGVALVERLVTDTRSPFYGDEPRSLSEELDRIQRAMSD
jgi:hypothetical protein